MAAPMSQACQQIFRYLSSTFSANSWKSTTKSVHIQRILYSTKVEKFASCPDQVFSGIQPTGIPHIGNYLGAIRHWVELQSKFPGTIFSIVDLHSVTVPWENVKLRENILNMTACLLACGIDPEKSILFQQSTVPQHTELSWILGCLCTMPRLQRLPQWKDKSVDKDVGVGLFTYPILQSADILLYRTTQVPVGEDQALHIELAGELSRAFNTRYGMFFPKPRVLAGSVTKIRSLRKPTAKMSKSDMDSKSRIDLNDPADLIREKVKKAVTDFTSALTYDPTSRPGVSNLIDIHAALTDQSADEICEQSLHLDTGQYKLALVDVLVEKLKPIREEIERLQDNKDYLENVLNIGQKKAHELAQSNMSQIRKLAGFR